MRLLKFLSRYLGILKFIPGLPQAADGVMQCWLYLFRPEVLDLIDEITEQLGQSTGITIVLHKFGGIEYLKENTAIGHIHGNGVLDIRFSPAVRQELINESKVQMHHTLPDSGWVSLQIKNRKDMETAVELLRLSYESS